MGTTPTGKESRASKTRRQPDRLAVVVIHGIGQQLPMDTLAGFAEAVLPEPARDGEPKYWSKPNPLASSYEVRRLTARKGDHRPTTDFFEYYWAHHTADTTYAHVLPWLKSLFFRRPTTLIPKVHGVWLIAWVTALAAACTWIYLFAVDVIGFTVESAVITLALAVAPLVLGFFGEVILLGYIGDSARYLHSSPDNVGIRQKIRAEGVDLLRKLHASGRYSEIIVVGHSLGSVIGYDILTHLWNHYRPIVDGHGNSALRHVERTARMLADNRHLYGQDPDAHDALVKRFARAQASLFEDIQRNAHTQGQRGKATDTPWLVSRFVTLGSPLAHAAYLVAHDEDDLKRRQTNRELPTCPPVFEPRTGFGYSSNSRSGHVQPRKLHQTAPFACTQWINLYFQPDLIGDPLINTFGPGIQNVKLPEQGVPLGRRLWASHVWYWRTRMSRPSGLPYPSDGVASTTTTVPHIHALRVALGFETPEPDQPFAAHPSIPNVGHDASGR